MRLLEWGPHFGVWSKHMYDVDLTVTATRSTTPAQVGVGLMEAWNTHSVDAVMAYYAPHYSGIDVGQATPLHGPDGKRETVVRYFTAFPDLHFTVEDVISEGDRVVVNWVASGTHRGAFMHIPATGRTINVRGMSML